MPCGFLCLSTVFTLYGDRLYSIIPLYIPQMVFDLCILCLHFTLQLPETTTASINCDQETTVRRTSTTASPIPVRMGERARMG